MREREALKLAIKYHPETSISTSVVRWYFSHNIRLSDKEYKISIQDNKHIHLFRGASWIDCIDQLRGYKFQDEDKIK